MLNTQITASVPAKHRRNTHLLGFVVVAGGGVADLDVLVGGRIEDFGVVELGGSFVVSIQ